MTDTTQNRGTLKEYPNSGRFVRENANFINLADIMGDAVDVSKALKVIDLEHSKIHQGYGWNVSIESGSISSAASFYVLFRVTDGSPHLRSYGVTVSDAPVTVRLFENPTVTATGAEAAIRNRKRSATDVNGIEVYTGPTVTADGTLLETDLLPSGGNKVGGNTGSFYEEWILEEGDYVLKITNGSNNTITAVINAFWYTTT
jgi:hypothetical protein